jgi:hypothetical protein
MRTRDIRTNKGFKPIIKIAIAAGIAGVVVFLTTLAPQAHAPVETRALPQASSKGDRLPLAVKGTACSKHGWPDFEQRCQFDFRKPANEGRKIRIIALR